MTMTTVPDAGSRRAAHRRPAGTAQNGSGLLGFLLYLSPVLLLSVIYPIVSGSLARHDAGGVSLPSVLLASSVTVPWLAQVGCLPVYRVLGPLMQRRDPAEMTGAMTENWVGLFVGTLPATVLCAAVVALVTRWPLGAVAVYLVLIVLHLLFVQSLVLGNALQRKGLWAAGWAGYALTLLAVPMLWWLPPLVGTLTQLVPMRSALPRLARLRTLAASALAVDMLRGLLLGAVLWSDKFVLYLTMRSTFPVTTVFAAMFPAVLAYNFYFVRYAPALDAAIAGLHGSIANDSMGATSDRAGTLAVVARNAVMRSLALGAVLTVAMLAVMAVTAPEKLVVAALVGVSSWMFVALTLLSYKLDYVGEKSRAQVYGAVHLAMVVVGSLFGSLNLVLTALIIVDGLMVGVAWTGYRRTWDALHYTLFWRHAISW